MQLTGYPSQPTPEVCGETSPTESGNVQDAEAGSSSGATEDDDVFDGPDDDGVGIIECRFRWDNLDIVVTATTTNLGATYNMEVSGNE
ncbi:hypothetical protein ACSSS7_001438 [Eimeria intestinalis]